MANSTKLRKRAQQLKGQPVCITLHNGRSYVGVDYRPEPGGSDSVQTQHA
ncbi:hypothetical protein ACFTAO_49465 [Paenibacillus rhizoplanae]